MKLNYKQDLKKYQKKYPKVDLLLADGGNKPNLKQRTDRRKTDRTRRRK